MREGRSGVCHRGTVDRGDRRAAGLDVGSCLAGGCGLGACPRRAARRPALVLDISKPISPPEVFTRRSRRGPATEARSARPAHGAEASFPHGGAPERGVRGFGARGSVPLARRLRGFFGGESANLGQRPEHGPVSACSNRWKERRIVHDRSILERRNLDLDGPVGGRLAKPGSQLAEITAPAGLAPSLPLPASRALRHDQGAGRKRSAWWWAPTPWHARMLLTEPGGCRAFRVD